MAGYIGSKASVVSSGAERKKTFAITTSTTSLAGLVYTPNQVHVFHNGIRLVDGTDYTATDGTTITLTNAAANGDEVVVVSQATFQTSDTVSASAGGTFVGDVTFDSNVGIGTTSPSTPLHVSKGGNGIVTFERSNKISGSGYLGFNVEANSQATIAFDDGGGLSIGRSGDPSTQAGYSNDFYINSSGRVGIGTISPSEPLDVSGGKIRIGNTKIGHAGSGGSWDMAFETYSGGYYERMRIDDAGRVAKPYQPFFKAWDSTGTHWQQANIVPNQVAHNVGNHYSNTTGRFTCPIAGVYIFRADWRCLGSQTNGTYMDIIASDGQLARHEEDANDVNVYHQSIFAMFKLAANDYVYIRAGGTGGIRWDTNATDSFSGYLLG